jgi:hypothetical protein
MTTTIVARRREAIIRGIHVSPTIKEMDVRISHTHVVWHKWIGGMRKDCAPQHPHVRVVAPVA